jgi:hypothetical protein
VFNSSVFDFGFKSEEMCENTRFPLRKTPENYDKFPFRDAKFYTLPEAGDMNAKQRTPRMGYVAQLSLEFLEATGRKPELENVPWLEAASNKGKR